MPSSEQQELLDLLGRHFAEIDRLAGERERREIIERDLGELKRHVAALQSRIEEIEQRLEP
jgi:hypothetical protein